MNKINGNIANDEKAMAALINARWKIITIWECELKPAILDTTLSTIEEQLR
jgi:DNA mismatch endonuclease (patch repair protein)